ncbi:MAG: bifunctional diaminohydroxyphosphoribosylaminopyrimidine deaminase/5-amino-6-(5-phosphoribosylamino)uracil reductase RibD [Hellea sp.]|nr:bifunctional diaminohydroxyphosphoribosylaminopyrimidine deaminase/5-amino-6-(5-phosphoribosylamino)uracil reductase RibD [Hellea sp.]
MPKLKADEFYMRRALELAQAQLGRTEPNPAVGCVLVRKGAIVGEGVTADGGRPHAETQAIKMAGSRAQQATAYVTLEPCSHYGQTPPCAKALIEAGIARCVIACIDPYPQVNWRGAALLQESGIDTVIGCCENEALELNAKFFKQVLAK